MLRALVPTTQPWKPPTTTTTLPIAPPSAGDSAAVDVPLPTNGRGYYSYSLVANTQYGRKQTIDALVRIGEAWFGRYPSGPKIGIGHISIKGGGDFPPHKSHRDGVDVDIRPLRQDHKQDPTNWKDPSYNRALTRDLVNLIRSTARIRSILFNDPELGQEKIYKLTPVTTTIFIHHLKGFRAGEQNTFSISFIDLFDNIIRIIITIAVLIMIGFIVIVVFYELFGILHRSKISKNIK